MVQPNNYMLNVADPLDRAFQGYATGLNAQAGQQQLAMNAAREARAAELQPLAIEGAQLGLAGQRQGLDIQAAQEGRAVDQFGMEKQAAQTELDRKQQFNSRMGDLAALGNKATQEDYRSVMTEFPDFAKGLSDIWGSIGAEQQRGTAEVLGQAAAALKAGNTELAKELGTRFRDAATNSGNADQAAAADAMLKLMETSPEAAMVSLRAMLTQNAPDIADAIFVNGANNRVQSTQMVGGRLSVQTMANGETRVIDTATNRQLTGEEAQDAISAAETAVADSERNKNRARTEGNLGAEIDLAGEAAAAAKAGTIAQDLGLKAFEQVGKIGSTISNIDQAISAIDNGAKSGQIESRAPAWNAATIELRNLQSQLGLDVVGSVTFGALSEGELRLALGTALPTNLDEPDLRDWLVRKRAAQEKLLSYMNEQARFLSRPGNTVSSWLDRVDATQGDSSGNKTTANPEQNRNSPSYLR
jgi:hypothetical protein